MENEGNPSSTALKTSVEDTWVEQGVVSHWNNTIESKCVVPEKNFFVGAVILTFTKGFAHLNSAADRNILRLNSYCHNLTILFLINWLNALSIKKIVENVIGSHSQRQCLQMSCFI